MRIHCQSGGTRGEIIRSFLSHSLALDTVGKRSLYQLRANVRLLLFLSLPAVMGATEDTFQLQSWSYATQRKLKPKRKLLSIGEMGHLLYGSVVQLTSVVYISGFHCNKTLQLLRYTPGHNHIMSFPQEIYLQRPWKDNTGIRIELQLK